MQILDQFGCNSSNIYVCFTFRSNLPPLGSISAHPRAWGRWPHDCGHANAEHGHISSKSRTGHACNRLENEIPPHQP